MPRSVRRRRDLPKCRRRWKRRRRRGKEEKHSRRNGLLREAIHADYRDEIDDVGREAGSLSSDDGSGRKCRKEKKRPVRRNRQRDFTDGTGKNSERGPSTNDPEGTGSTKSRRGKRREKDLHRNAKQGSPCIETGMATARKWQQLQSVTYHGAALPGSTASFLFICNQGSSVSWTAGQSQGHASQPSYDRVYVFI
ncbi:hypothetical protein M405DRAFT_841998 [Rhizopogon salebrosus TDB-379]|nr:hypothetical protein M405DRAFT_841998 [Rhizopogon salebrosus TDB-379]